jgi:hypothetical protein
MSTRRVFAPRAAILLEVLISMGLLLFGMAFVGMQVNTGLIAAKHADIGMRAVMLADSKIAELKANVIQPQLNEQEIMGDFGIAFPGYTWRLQIRPCETAKLYMAALEVGYNEKQVLTKIAAPDQEIRFDDADTRIVQTVYRLVPTPADVNIQRDFGITQAEIDDAMQSAQDVTGGVGSGGGTGEIPSGDGGAGGGGGGGQPDLAALMKILGPYLQGPSFDPKMFAQLPPEDFQAITDLLGPFLKPGGGGGGLPRDALAEIKKLVEENPGKLGPNSPKRPGQPQKPGDDAENFPPTGPKPPVGPNIKPPKKPKP